MKYYRLLHMMAAMVAIFNWAAALRKSPILAIPPNLKNSFIFGDQHDVRISTLNVFQNGYEGSLFMQFTNMAGRVSKVFTATDAKLLPGIPLVVRLWIRKEFGKIKRIKIWIDNPADLDNNFRWGAELIQVIPKSTGDPIYFPCVRRIYQKRSSKFTYTFDEFNTYLPQYDPRPADRFEELKDNRKIYAFSTQHLKDDYYRGTPLIKTIPISELFPVNYTAYSSLAILTEVTGNILQKNEFARTWKSYDEMRKVFGKTQRTPLYINKDFTSDVWFGRQRLQGVNPASIKLAKTIPKTFGVTDYLLENLLEDKKLNDALNQSRLFIVDLRMQKGLYEDYDIKVSAPIALFYLNDADVLLPVAIQLFQGIRESNPVFTPNDDGNVWQNAKNHFQVADGSYHESITHLGTTHLLIESVIGCTYQNLAHNHPVFRLLRPHFLATLSINKLAFSLLVDDGTAVDFTLSITGSGMKRLAGIGLRNYNMARDAIVPTMFERAGVTEDVIEDYPFRDDISLAYKTIKKFVSKIVEFYYENDRVLRQDTEIQSWRRQLTASRKKGVENSNKAKGRFGLGLKGVPGTDKGFRTREELIEVVTVFINTASTKHAAVSYLQYDWYAFAPHHPLYLSGPFPTSKAPITEQEILGQFAERNRFLNLAFLVNSISNRVTQNLGYPEVPMFYDPRAADILDEFRNDLKEVHNEIVRRNDIRAENSYVWCDVDRVPNAISI